MCVSMCVSDIDEKNRNVYLCTWRAANSKKKTLLTKYIGKINSITNKS